MTPSQYVFSAQKYEASDLSCESRYLLERVYRLL
jgi:hypothetical protein